ncbi:MAG: radical SAM protein [Candidatus Riflebacteria bacterium HGW-Riflebacteria-2]|jgi:biotin synthase|nr:MAG: radical SAM protein [Candidatus Riflebacteria bacterium HGW-Riflebacteria-2]
MKIRVSYGTAIVLGLVHARQDVAPTTAYLLFDRGCIGQCSFCSRANGNVRSQKLSRIIWPEFELEQVLEKLTTPPLPFARICLQTGYNPESESELKSLAQQFVKTGIATSVTLSPSQTLLAGEMLEMGLDHVGIGLDAASPPTYATHKKKNWQQDWPALLDLLSKVGDRIEVHLIFGLGDSEEAFCQRIQAIIDGGGKISLFALTPVNGGNPPEFAAYRRVQAFRFLCEKQKVRVDDCQFADGRLTGFPIAGANLCEALENGDAFRTSGCGNCNRPYYNERPGQLFYNYPRPLSSPEFTAAVEVMALADR